MLTLLYLPIWVKIIIVAMAVLVLWMTKVAYKSEDIEFVHIIRFLFRKLIQIIKLPFKIALRNDSYRITDKESLAIDTAHEQYQAEQDLKESQPLRHPLMM
jgi:hypothetical protein